MTPMEEQRRFEVQASLTTTDNALEQLAASRSLEVNRDAQPNVRAVPRDYLATVITRRCLLMVEGFGPAASAKVTVTLEADQGAKCDGRMHAFFGDLRARLEAPRS